MKEPLYKQIKDPVTKKWFHHVWLMAHRYKYGWSQVFTGMPGSGKTMSATQYAELLSPPGEFTADNVAFTPKGYLDTLENLKPGQPVVWSELGVGLPSRRWHSLSNILISQVIQTMRIKKPIVLMDVSDLSFIDVQARKLIFCYSEAKRWGSNPVKLWLYRIKIVRRTGDIFWPHPLIKCNGRIVKLRYITIKRKPDEDLWKEIDRKQRHFKSGLEEKARKMIGLMKKELIGGRTIMDMINEVQKDRKKFLNKGGKLDVYLLQTHLNVGKGKAMQVKRFIDTQVGQGG